jgi:hypothetical protein
MANYNNVKELRKALENVTSEQIELGGFDVTIYRLPTQQKVYYDIRGTIALKTNDTNYNEENYIYFYIEKMSVGGGGYDRWSTALSNSINIFKNVLKLKNSIKWENEYNGYLKNSRLYGLYQDKTISYGIGVPSVLYATKGYKNLELTKQYQGKYEDSYSFEIKGDK